MQSRSSHPGNFKLISKFSQMRPVFPDYLSVSYDYGLMSSRAETSKNKIKSLWPKLGPNRFSSIFFLTLCGQRHSRNLIILFNLMLPSVQLNLLVFTLISFEFQCKRVAASVKLVQQNINYGRNDRIFH